MRETLLENAWKPVQITKLTKDFLNVIFNLQMYLHLGAIPKIFIIMDKILKNFAILIWLEINFFTYKIKKFKRKKDIAIQMKYTSKDWEFFHHVNLKSHILVIKWVIRDAQYKLDADKNLLNVLIMWMKK